MTPSLIQDLIVILTAGLFAGLVCRWLSVSVLIGYLLVGTMLGQGGLGLVLDREHQLEHYAEAGVFLLLFSIGLEFSIDDLKRLGKHFVIAGAMQMCLVVVPVGWLLYASSMNWQSSILVAAALSFSSTVLVFKSLSEWGQAGRPHGRRAIGILLFQDAALIPLLLVVPLLSGEGQAASLQDYGILVIVAIVFVLAIICLRYLLSNWLIPMFTGYRSPELVILFTLVSLGSVTLVAYWIGLPPAIGAFSAGIIFNGNRWTKQIDALVLPFRETFAAVFFVGLGLIFDPRLVWNEPLWLLAALSGIMVIKGMAATLALLTTGLPLRHSLGMGIGLAHVGEFAFVLVLLGLEASVLSEVVYQRVVAIAVGSLILTPFLIKVGLKLINDDGHDDRPARLIPDLLELNQRAAVIGAGPIGRQVASQLEISGKEVCLIDLSPINLQPFAQEGFRTVAGDASDENILRLADVDACGLLAVCVPHDESALSIVKAIRAINPRAKILVRCRYQANAEKLRRLGADHIVSEEAEASTALLRLLNS